MKQLHITITGRVQGVGFRPFIYTQAIAHSLTGWVKNDSQGVEIILQGSDKSLQACLFFLQNNQPPLAVISHFSFKWEEITIPYATFTIQQTSISHETLSHIFIPPDVSLCPECLHELNDPQNRRFAHPFISCTQCGPRYTIIHSLPYDRISTSLSSFPLCQECSHEYHNPLDRRYHAQPISCHICGPILSYHDNDHTYYRNEALNYAIEQLHQGKILAIKGVGGFHLVCDATNDTTVRLLRERKKRPKKPFALLVSDTQQALTLGHFSTMALTFLTSKERPIVLVKKQFPLKISPFIAPDGDLIGLFLPYSPLHFLLLKSLSFPLVATSANISDEPIIVDSTTLQETLGDVIDGYLDYNRDIVQSCDDSVIRCDGDIPIWIRLGRGHTPLVLPSPYQNSTLALGAGQKCTIAFNYDNHAILSPHIGDVKTLKAHEYFSSLYHHLTTIHHFKPESIIIDKHPHYFSSQFAKTLSLPYQTIQHHKAHFYACLSEHQQYFTPHLGIVWDGTGVGDDGLLWGGEFFIGNIQSCERIATFKPLKLLGGEVAIKEPRRIALALLIDTFKTLETIPPTPIDVAFSSQEKLLLSKIYPSSIESHSVGRLFDGIASLLGLIHKLDYEGQSGVILESYYDTKHHYPPYPFFFDGFYYDISPMITELLSDECSIAINRFLRTLVAIICHCAEQYNLPVAFSGGVFQNASLVTEILKTFHAKNLTALFHTTLPPNDACISYGQLIGEKN